MQDPPPIRVVYVTDQGYEELTEFSARSLMLFSKSGLDIIIYNISREDDVNTELASFAKTRGHRVEKRYLSTPEDITSGVPLHPHISAATLFKASAIEIEARSYEHILFVDGDVLACRNFDATSIFDFHTTAAAVFDFVSYMPYDGQNLFKHRSSRQRSPDYFNAGVIAINGRSWIEKQLTTDYIRNLSLHTAECPFRHDEHGRDPGDCKGADQCALNMTLENDWTPIDFRWNVQKPLRHLPLWRSAYFRHYTGFRKFLAESSVNRDDIERRVIRSIEAAAGRPPRKMQHDLGLLFVADRLKYWADTRAYSKKVTGLLAHAEERRSVLSTGT